MSCLNFSNCILKAFVVLSGSFFHHALLRPAKETSEPAGLNDANVGRYNGSTE